jgi:protein SCO1/2
MTDDTDTPMGGADGGLTRGRWIAMAGLPTLAGFGSYEATARALRQEDGRARFQPVGPGSARARIQQTHLPNLPLVTHEGESVRFYDDLVKDRKVVLTFISTGVLPDSTKVAENLAAVQRFFGTRVGSDIFLYSITRTPERDTPSVLRDWAARHGAGPGWTFLTGEPSDVERLRHSLGFASPDPIEDADPAYSIGQLRHGVEPEMRWAHCESQAAPRVIAHSMLLDFGTGPGVPAALPLWNCSLLLAGVD